MKYNLIFFTLFLFIISKSYSQNILTPTIFVDKTVVEGFRDSLQVGEKYRKACKDFIASRQIELGYKITDNEKEATVRFHFSLTYAQSDKVKLIRCVYFIDTISKDTITWFGTGSYDASELVLRDSSSIMRDKLPAIIPTYAEFAELNLVALLPSIFCPFQINLAIDKVKIFEKGFKTLRHISIDEYIKIKNSRDTSLAVRLTDLLSNSTISHALYDDKYIKTEDKKKNKFLFYRNYQTPKHKTKTDIVISAEMELVNEKTYHLSIFFKGSKIYLEYFNGDKLKTDYLLDKSRIDKGDYTQLIYRINRTISGFMAYNFSSFL